MEDQQAMEDLRGRGIKALPVTIIDDKEVIIGYFPKKLIPAFKLDVKVDLSEKTEWLADKYERILSAAVRAAPQFTQEQLDTTCLGARGRFEKPSCTSCLSQKWPI